MIVADVLGPCHCVDVTDEDGNAYIDRRRQPQFLHDVPGIAGSVDVTAQLAEHIPPEPGYAVWRVWCDDAQLEALVAHPSYAVLRQAEADACISPTDWPRIIVTPERASENDAFPPLPDAGWLEAGTIYQHGGRTLIVRQSHNRTEHDPADVPALFMVHREDAADLLPWIAGEQVYVGTRRSYGWTLYECIQAHVTQSDWTPDRTPALWRAIEDAPSEPEPEPKWRAGVAYTVGDIVTYEGKRYECRQAHTSQVGWEPPKVLALWLPL